MIQKLVGDGKVSENVGLSILTSLVENLIVNNNPEWKAAMPIINEVLGGIIKKS